MRSYNREDWIKVRAAGKRWFLLRNAVIARGLPMGIVVALVIEMYLGRPIPDALLEPPFLARLLLAVGVFSLSSSLSALANWRYHERRYGSED